MDSYTQCFLTKPVDLACGQELYKVAFIPSKFAVYGKTLKIRSGDFWEDGWIVEKVYKNTITNVLPDSHIQIKKHRKRTGDR